MYELTLKDWFLRFFTGKPHFTIWTELEEGEGITEPQLLRWWILPRNKYFNIYLHKVIRDDEDRALHDHPWNSLSLLLWGKLGESYFTHEPNSDQFETYMGVLQQEQPTSSHVMKPGRFRYRPAEFAHRLFLPDPGKPAWTLFMTGPKFRKWGFWCRKGWMRWEEFCQIDDPGKPKGCGELA